ncbi:MAG: SUMF1/EgtB/PvdO family nonheme iron enzyme [Verrucomicrobia bacterium]|nr:SUMF1/EgtB/PvdO family nonheme iron enzyme [Verrucomicrobiota bacterium]
MINNKTETTTLMRRGVAALVCALLLMCCSTVRAQNDPDARFRGTGKADLIRISKATCEPSGVKGAGVIAFDIAWDHSWRAAWDVGEEQHEASGTLSLENWDAAWVFVKVRRPGTAGWSQATLSNDRAHHTVPAGAALDLAPSSDGKRGAGVFIYRDAAGHGANNWKGVTLRWMHAADGVPDLNKVMLSNDKLTRWLAGAGIMPDLDKTFPADDGLGLDDSFSSEDGLDGLLQGEDGVEIQVHAIMMVYVPQSPFWAGDGATPDLPQSAFWAEATNAWEYSPLGKPESVVAGQFSAGDSAAPFRITSENEMTIGGESTDVLNNRDAIGMQLIDDFNMDQPRTLPAGFPKGYRAFYCMKHEVTQGEYVAFLNTIANAGAHRIVLPPEAPHYRYSITGEGGSLGATEPYVACNYLSSIDGLAYAAWAGLRPMTELEYEKACRGPLKPVPNECAWGTDRVAGMEAESGGYTINNPGGPDETVTWVGSNSPFDKAQGGTDAAHGNALWEGTARRIPAGSAQSGGPLRVGIFARPDSDRARAGASYWGIMELSGNLGELAVTVGSPAGRGFGGTHGDGTPVPPAGWNFVAREGGSDSYQSSGIGSRGEGGKSLRTSSRRSAAVGGSTRTRSSGFRAVHTAP